MNDQTQTGAAPGFWQALVNALRNFGQQGNIDPRAEAARAASQQMAQPMPAVVMPHEALQRKAQERALMDAMLREGQ